TTGTSWLRLCATSPRRRSAHDHFEIAESTERSLEDDGELPILWSVAASHAGRSRHVSALRELSGRRSAELDGAVLPATRVRVRPLLARAARGIRAARAHLQRVRLFLFVLDVVVPARRRLHPRDAGPLRARA